MTAVLALTLASAAGAQTPMPAPAPGMPMPRDTMMRDSSMRGMPRAGMMQDSMARRGPMQDSAAGGTMRDTGFMAQVDSVNTAAKSGLTSLAPAAASALIQSIETRLRASSRVSLRSIATDLAALRRELGMATVSGPRVGTILRRVGPKVTAASAGQRGMARTMLAEIGRELTAAGRQLAPAR